ncbi:sensor histidine kinase [Streptomyces sp. NPDC048639]|uniref:sensor histidine kinase n=1 Tax=Streptomyces sp. NPDC048639 TaxID=3365581 RepID=UPI00371F62EB
MNETTTPPAWTESRIARVAWHGLREDLLRAAWAFRPLPPISAERIAAWPRLERRGGRWLPHAAILVLAFFFFLADYSAATGWSPWSDLLALLFAVAHTAPLVLVLLRPVGAWWLSLAVTVVSLYLPDLSGEAYFLHVVVMVLVTFRSRPRVAIEMWVISALAMGVFSAVGDGDNTEVGGLAVLSGFFLGIAVALRGWWLARGRVAEQETLVADVRGQHTLLEERARIARELHDVVAHHMSVIAIQAEAAPYRVSDPPEELTKSFSTIRGSAVEALAELRRVLGVLRFESPDGTAVPDAPQPDLSRLDELVEGVRAVGLDVEVARTGATRPLPQGVELSAYRIIQEALSNALRHAPGSQVRVEVAYVLTGIGVRIVNTRPTADVRPSPGLGHGVMGMRERASMLGGELTAEPTADGGFEVAAFLPVGQADAQEGPA